MAFGGLRGSLTGGAASIAASNSVTGSVVVSVGDLVFVVGAEQTSNTLGTCTDNLGNTYTAQNAGTLSGSTVAGRAHYSRVTVAGTLTTITYTASSSTHDCAFGAVVIEGPFTAPPIDANAANITSDVTSPFTCPTTGTLGQASEVVICWGVWNTSTAWAATSPNLLGVNKNQSASASCAIGYQAVSATTAVIPAFTSASNPTAAVLGTASFKNGSVAVSANPTGNAATGSVGTITVSLNTPVSITGVSATGGAGDMTGSYITDENNLVIKDENGNPIWDERGLEVGKANVSLTTVAATGQTGTIAVSGKANVTLTGVAGSGVANTVTTAVTATVNLTGVNATGQVNTPTVTGTANVPLNGVAATGQVGTLTASTKVNVTLTGVSATGQVNTVTVTAAANVTLTGVEATGQVGTLTATVASSSTAIISGVFATGEVGTLTADVPAPPVTDEFTHSKPFLVTVGPLLTIR